jgi:signal transduction histidine kinase
MSKTENLSNEQLLLELKKRLTEDQANKKKLEELTHSIKVLNKKLAESEAMKSHFISNIRNELINPFTSVMALAENILGVDKENWKKVIHMVSLIHTEVFNLDFQLKNIFAAAKLETGEIKPEITLVNIDMLIENIIDVFNYEARRKHLSIEYTSNNVSADSAIYFKSDAEKIHLILCNLLSNAIKFSFADGIIQIGAKKDLSTLSLSVKDYGQGISKANEQIIFDRFKRLDSGINSINRGHGLGLSIIKAIIDMLNGKIKFESSQGKGTTFTILLTESDQETSGISTNADETFFKEEQF